jgi:hypothetical protein
LNEAYDNRGVFPPWPRAVLVAPDGEVWKMQAGKQAPSVGPRAAENETATEKAREEERQRLLAEQLPQVRGAFTNGCRGTCLLKIWSTPAWSD